MNSAITVVETTGADQELIAASPHRKALMIGQPSGGSLRLMPGIGPTGSRGIFLDATLPPLVFTVKDHGDLATREWRMFASAAANFVTVVEVY